MNAQITDPFWIGVLLKCGACAGAFIALYKLYRAMRRNVFSKFGEFFGQVNKISAELKPNGGGSMRDQVNTAMANVEHLTQSLRSFFQFDNNGLYEMDKKGECIWVNHAYLDIVKRHPDEVMGTGWRNMVAERDRDRVVHEYMSAVADKRDCFLHMHLLDSLGNEIEIETRALRMVTPKGELIGHFGYVIRYDRPPPGCRWCRAIEELTHENYRLLKEKGSIVLDADVLTRMNRVVSNIATDRPGQ